MKSTVVATTLLSILLPCLHAQPEQILGVTILEPDELKAGLDEGACEYYLQ